MAIYKGGRGVEPGWSTVKQLQVAVSAGLEPGTSRFQVRRPNHVDIFGPGKWLLWRASSLCDLMAIFQLHAIVC